MKGSIKSVAIALLVPILLVFGAPLKALSCHVYVDGWMTDTEGRLIPGDIFQLVVGNRGIITSTNPGGFFYHVEVSVQDWALNSLTISALIPPEFDLQGGKAVKVYLNGSQVYNGSDLSHTLYNVPAFAVVHMMVHLKYGEIRNPINPPYPKVYTFDAMFNFDPYSEVYGSAQATLTAEL